MSNAPPKLILWPRFDRELARLKRKYPNVEEDLRKAMASPTTRLDAVPGYSHRVWKARVPSSDMRRGARGSFRLYMWMEVSTPEELQIRYPLAMYPKGERVDLTKTQLRHALERLFDWIEGG